MTARFSAVIRFTVLCSATLKQQSHQHPVTMLRNYSMYCIYDAQKHCCTAYTTIRSFFNFVAQSHSNMSDDHSMVCLREKTSAFNFCDNFVRCPISLIFGRNIPDGICSIMTVITYLLKNR